MTDLNVLARNVEQLSSTDHSPLERQGGRTDRSDKGSSGAQGGGGVNHYEPAAAPRGRAQGKSAARGINETRIGTVGDPLPIYGQGCVLCGQ